TEAGFRSFNERYVERLVAWEILADGLNPVARSNVCPELDPPEEPSFHAFTFAVAAPGAPPSFASAGSGEVEEGPASYRDRIVARGDVSLAGLRAKARRVLSEMERRMGLLGGAWERATGVQVYTVHDIHPLIADEIVARGAARHGITWHF